MKHRIKGSSLNLTSDQRKALLKNLATSLVLHGQVKTTLPKAKAVRVFVERVITKGRDPKNTGLVHQRLRSNEATKKVMNELAERYKSRPGGYTRIIKAGHRSGDGAPMAVIQLVD